MSARNFDLFGTRRAFGNVTVERLVDGNGASISVYLHGNRVFRLYPEAHKIQLSNCGWCTQTTHKAINTALSQVPMARGIRVSSVKGQTMLYLPNGQVRPLVNGETLDLISIEVGAVING